MRVSVRGEPGHMRHLLQAVHTQYYASATQASQRIQKRQGFRPHRTSQILSKCQISRGF